MTDRQSTHGHDCWGWGPKHYECAVREVKALRAEVEGWKEQHARDSAELRRICQHRDEYKARADRLAEALRDAEKSLRTIADHAGNTEYLMDIGDVRGYANSRANEARAALTKEDRND